MLTVIDGDWAAVEWDMKSAARTKRFWLLVGAFFSVAFANQSVLLHAVSAMVDSGINRTTAAYFFGIAGIAGSGGKILFGYLSDIMGREQTKLISDLVAVIGIGALMAISLVKGPMPLLFGLLFGLGYGAVAPLIPSITADIFLGKNFGKIFAIIAIGGGTGGAVGSYASGLMRDLRVLYRTVFNLYRSYFVVLFSGYSGSPWKGAKTPQACLGQERCFMETHGGGFYLRRRKRWVFFSFFHNALMIMTGMFSA